MRHNRMVLPMALVGAGSGIAFLLLKRRVMAHETRRVDGQVRKRFRKRRRPIARAFATGIGPLGKWWGQMPVSLGIATVAWRARGPRAAAPIAAASAAAAALAWVLEQAITPRTPPPGRHQPSEPAFPSGHALNTSAAAWTAAYVLVREGLVSPASAIPLAIALPAASGLAKLYTDGHWFTDVAGGYLLGATVAAAAATGHELARPRRRSIVARLAR
ncbi:MAG TPA: phosphatase PAP2 family protein [Gemmatimonadaceae bacterium]|nr:phosphatase PAP2 family protein [Gemmatimonadaceae bacterium]